MAIISASVSDPVRSAEMKQALSRLSPHQRAALLLREIEEHSFAEIAAVLRCNESTARVHHTRARQKMRGLLERAAGRVVTGDLERQRT